MTTIPYAPLLSGSALDGRYELRRVIGEGTFGRVYEGFDRRLARRVAVKVIKPWWAEDADWVASFERETQLLARLSDPGIVQIFDVGQAPEGPYYVAELVDGENLAQRLRRASLSPWEASGIATQLCRALSRAHAERIVHRDVKPANILLSTTGRVKVGDFGVAQLAEGSTDVGAIVGTPKYMAPEQGRGLPTTPATDVYSVGVVLYEMLAGKPPFVGDSAVELALHHLQDPPPPLSSRLPPELVAVTERALQKDPAARYADAGEMADALADARRGVGRAGPASAQATTRSRAAAAPAPRRRSAPRRPGDDITRPSYEPPTSRLRDGDQSTSRLRDGEPPTSRLRDGEQPTSRLRAGDQPTTRLPGKDRPPTGSGGGDRASASRTLHQPRRAQRRNLNPAARRRTVAAFGIVLALLAAMVFGALSLGPSARSRVPELTGATKADAAAAAGQADLHAVFTKAWSAKPVGTVISQHPRPGSRIARGSAVHAIISRGLRPVEVPLVVKEGESSAEATLAHFGLHASIVPVAAPGITPGTVTRTSPAPGGKIRAHGRVTLYVAEVPRWRTLTTFRGRDSGSFRIQGTHWRVVYQMSFQGTCTWIFWCSGPNARVLNASSGTPVAGFGLGDGGTQTQEFATGPGEYRIAVSPGGDTANWSVEVQDYY